MYGWAFFHRALAEQPVQSFPAACTAEMQRFFRKKIASLRIFRPELETQAKSGWGGSGGEGTSPSTSNKTGKTFACFIAYA